MLIQIFFYKRQVESHWLPKNRQKRQIALSEYPFRAALFGVTPERDMQRKIISYFIRNQIEDFKAVKNRITPQA